ncbi:MAG TPA: heme peroxidase family protein [Candidatus Elarobacter sp.]|jgi:hypothetical protein
MAKPNPIRPHGVGVRGAALSRSSPLFEGPFGRIFRALPPADFGSNDTASVAALGKLAAKMVSAADPADPKDGPDSEESGIPAAYTYFGQFIDHDLTFDPASSLQRQNDPDALVDYRSPRFDLDNVYGRGPADQPYMYEDGRSFHLGLPLSGAAANPHAKDLPRSQANPKRAIIGDPRNDENVIISEFQGLLHRFHNKIANDNATWTFAQVQREVRFHYQWVVLNDFLPAIIDEEVLELVLPRPHHHQHLFRPNLEFYKPKNETFMPLEFSAAAYRFGHSMVRPGYRLSETVPPLAIFGPNPNAALTGFRQFPNNWAIDWNLFMDLVPRDPDDRTRTQLAYKIDTALVDPLGMLPPSIANDPPPSLAFRNLQRGWRMRLPNGQDIARAMGVVPLADKDILIGKFTGNPGDIIGSIDTIDPAFRGNCPLWTYVLAETRESDVALKTTKGTKKIKTRKLGPVGGRIVAETIVGLLAFDSQSYVVQNPLWKPSLAVGGIFGLRELIATALSF